MSLEKSSITVWENTFSVGRVIIKQLKFKNTEIPSLLFSASGQHFLLPLLDGITFYVASIKWIDKIFFQDREGNILTIGEYVDIRLREKKLLDTLETDQFFGKTIISWTHEFEQIHHRFIESFLLFVDEHRGFTFGNGVEKQLIEKRREIVKIVS